MADSIRIRMDGDRAYRKDVIARAREIWDTNQTDAVIYSCEYTARMIEALDRAKDHPDMTSELAEILSTPHVQIERRTETELKID